MTEETAEPSDFDLEAHAEKAAVDFRSVRPQYEQLAEVARRIIGEMLEVSEVRVHSIEARAKSLESFQRKAAKPSSTEPSKPRYLNPVRDITDLAGVRVITFLPRTVDQVCALVEREFTVLEKTDKAAELFDEGTFGYQSIHFVVQMHLNRVRLPEYQRHGGLTFEIQVRTLLQHAWAEMEHDIQYKSTTVIPTPIRRRFISLAGLLEIADKEFQGLQDEDQSLRQNARDPVKAGILSNVEITPDALKSYLDTKYGTDGRMTDWGYESAARMVRKLGFETLSQLEECIAGYDDDHVSRRIWGYRQGQLSRFEDVLLAAMGDNFTARHPWNIHPGWPERWQRRLTSLANGGVNIGKYDPKSPGAA